MKIECSGCHKVYIIPEDRFPKDKDRFAFPCPACKEIIHVERTAEPKDVEFPANAPPSPESVEKLKAKILARLGDLPAVSRVVFKARDVMANPDLGIKELAGVIEKDPAMVSKVLRVANSAYYGLSGTVSSIQHATVLLGVKRVGEIISMSGASRLIDKPLAGYKMESGELWEHSLSVAFASKMILQKQNSELSSDAFVAGLIHDIGKMILDPYIAENVDLFESFIANGMTPIEAETQLLGFSHTEMGYEACVAWGIPEALRTAIRFHHNPSESGDRLLAYAVAFGDVLAGMSGVGTSAEGLVYPMETETMARLGATDEDILSVLGDMVESVQKVEEDILGE